MDETIRNLVRQRAGNVCEYCRLIQAGQAWARFHIEHVRPRQHQGTGDLDNLCLACGHCNRYKGPNLASIDPVTNELTPLFNPRIDRWAEHFLLSEHSILGVSPSVA
ncbi:HNH endonuclease [Bythopirellula goksoeyrii]|uniref:HNH endonuclease n=1 Tax=Bythopirellula goksoeyrii TaxID=1400387 RepID=A0A5B9QAE0_9BACT|nr:HNH endonuclease [Bythopirellula goksoeyrii]QEG33856.1 HNH endonuclease [Bythopirellula goksoeyrii]